MDLVEFVDTYVGTEPGVPFEDTGPGAMHLMNLLNGDVPRVRQLLSWNFWNAYLNTDLWKKSVITFGILDSSAQTVLVERPQISRSDLVVLHPALPGTPTPELLQFDPDELTNGWNVWRTQLSERQRRNTSFMTADMAIQIYLSQSFFAIYAQAPEMEDLSVPATIQNVRSATSSRIVSTAGIVVKDKQSSSTKGVTSALHPLLKANSTLQSGDQVMVGPATGILRQFDTLTDSAFIQLPHLPTMRTIANGVMSGKIPWTTQAATFEGVSTSAGTTRITGTDPALPTVLPNNQLRVYTGRDAQPGDSGAALITDDDHIVGFMYQRTRFNTVPAFCSWIWAESVLDCLNVEAV